MPRLQPNPHCARAPHSLPCGCVSDVWERGSCFISSSSTTVTEINDHGERRIVTVHDE
jgi:hypothetical protein